jgi:similar to stage IV sporulation protein
VNRKGLPFYRRVIRRRWMLLMGSLIFILGLYILSSFVWFLEIRGTNTVKAETVTQSAAHFGLQRWAFKGSFDKTQVEEGILREIPELSYVEVNIKGVKAVVKVVEKVLPGEQLVGPCNLVAARGGVIEEVMVLDGIAAVQKGDIVGVGTILISGTIIPEGEYVQELTPPPRLVQAQGTVKARVWYEGYGEHPLVEEKIVLTGNKSEGIRLETPWGKWDIKQPGQNFASFETRKSDHRLDTPWGEIVWVTETVLETRTNVEEFDPQVATEMARKEALANLRNETKGVDQILSTKTKLISSASDNIIRIKAEAEVIEDICRPQPLNMEEELPQYSD